MEKTTEELEARIKELEEQQTTLTKENESLKLEKHDLENKINWLNEDRLHQNTNTKKGNYNILEDYE